MLHLQTQIHGTAVGYNGTILRTTDGGETWNSQASGTTVALNGVSFTDENNGAIVGSSSGSAVFLSTSNGGESGHYKPRIYGIGISE